MTAMKHPTDNVKIEVAAPVKRVKDTTPLCMDAESVMQRTLAEHEAMARSDPKKYYSDPKWGGPLENWQYGRAPNAAAGAAEACRTAGWHDMARRWSVLVRN
jgi:hypothetical protein